MKPIKGKMKGFDMPISMAAIVLVFVIVAFILLYALSKFKLI